MYEKEDFRGFLDRLRGEKELVDIKQPVDIRHIATLVDQSDSALFFHDVIGYDMPVATSPRSSSGCSRASNTRSPRNTSRPPGARKSSSWTRKWTSSACPSRCPQSTTAAP
jgi:3-polyprenyl-4-hydroxybenzoate decarboxylase